MGSGPIPVATSDAGRAYRDLHRPGRWTKHNKRTKTKPQRHASPNQGRRHDVLPRKQARITSGDLRESGKPGGVRIKVANLGIARRNTRRSRTSAEPSGPSDRLAACTRGGVADRGDVGLVGVLRAAPEHGRARDESVGAGCGEGTCDVGADAAVDLDVDRTAC